MESENPLQGGNNVLGVKKTEKELQGNSEGSQPTDETKEDAEARNDFWSMEGDFICRHHVEPRVQPCVPKEETFPLPLKYMDVTRTTHTKFDVLRDSRVDDFWNVDVDRNVSDSWTGFTKFTLLDEKSPTGHTWSGRRLAQIRATTRPDCLWPEIWTGMSKAALNMEKQECIYFIDPEDGEHKETITNARKSWTFRWRRLCLA